MAGEWPPPKPDGVPDEVWAEVVAEIDREGAAYERQLADGLAEHDAG